MKATPAQTYAVTVDGIGTVDDQAYVEATKAYVEASSGDKARMRTHLTATAQKAMLDLDVTNESAVARVKALVALQGHQSEAAGSKSAKAEVDYTDLVARRMAGLSVAWDLINTFTVLPEVPEGTEIDFERMLELADGYTKADEANLPILVEALALVQAKVGRRTSVAGGDIAAHIYEALSQVPAGTVLTVAQIKSAQTEAYPNGAPSGGAISARLFPTKGECTVDGVTPVTVEGKKAARLA